MSCRPIEPSAAASDFADHGGAISSRNGDPQCHRNSTFIDNQAIGGASGGNAYGGAIENDAATATVTGSIFAGNQAVGGDGGDGRREQSLSLAMAVGGGIESGNGWKPAHGPEQRASWRQPGRSPAAVAPAAKARASTLVDNAARAASGIPTSYDR